MKIKKSEKSLEEVLALAKNEVFVPKKPSMLFRTLLKVVSYADLKATNFSYREFGMERLGKDEPCIILMNHSAFIDLKIATSVFYPRPMNIVCTYDGFVGKYWLMRSLGCVPTNKFITDINLVKNIHYCLKTLKSSVLMYPEASYSFDGTATPLPEGVGKCLKYMKVPVVMVKTYGAFARDPLYNNLKLRKVNVSADISYIFSPEELEKATVKEINQKLKEQFTFDNFRWQQENNVKIDEPFRAEGLNRVLYKCPHCGKEGFMEGADTTIRCNACGKSYELTEYGYLKAQDGDTRFDHVPDWYAWERECVREEILSGSYSLKCDVDIFMLVNTDSIYKVGSGVLRHDKDGFSLVGCDGKINYSQKPISSYSLYSDYFWYEIGDMICIGNGKETYYCFPKNCGDVVAKTRLATEELYKLTKA